MCNVGIVFHIARRMVWVIHTAAQIISEKFIVIGSVCKLDPIIAPAIVIAIVIAT